jgi:hypothetical protein
MSSRIKTNVVLEQIRTKVRTICYYRQNKLLLYSEQDIILARTNLYVISNKQKYSVRENENNSHNKILL